MPYDIYIEPDVHNERRSLPGYVRQRIGRAIDALITTPRPAPSQPLDVTGLDVPAGVEIRRIRIERWRVVYAVCDNEAWVRILALHERPPYDYDDLAQLADKLRDT